ncbi:hypothetical protein [Kluyvera ascorbata]|nr:hypothetical protein [Kluyvera ascorbata]
MKKVVVNFAPFPESVRSTSSGLQARTNVARPSVSDAGNTLKMGIKS